MATFYGTDAQDLETARTSGQRKFTRMANDTLVFKDTYVFKGTEVTGDEIILSRELPAGLFIIPIATRIHTVAVPAATAMVVTMGIGTAGNILSATSVNAVGVVSGTGREIELIQATQPKMVLTTVTGAVTAGAVIDVYFFIRSTS
jgi:hypothetical protein